MGNGTKRKESTSSIVLGVIIPLALSVCPSVVINMVQGDSNLCLILSNLFNHTKGEARDNASV